MDTSCSGQGLVADSYEHGNETSGFINIWEFREWLSDC